MRDDTESQEGTAVCSMCGQKIRGDYLSCSLCNAVFHRACAVDHFYYYNFCPVCKRETSFIDLEVTSLHPVMEYTEHARIREERLIPQQIRKPHWPPSDEIPLFERVSKPAPRQYISEPVYIPKLQRKGSWQIFRTDFLSRGTTAKLRKNKKAMLGLCMLSAAIIIAICAPFLILYNPVIYMAEDEFVYHPPTWKYPLGTDVLGRDVYSQVIWGFRSALVIAIPSAALVGVIGTVVGLASGYYGRAVDAVLQRISMTFLVWPSVPFVALIVFSWGPHMALLAVILGVAFTLWPTTARAVRAEVLSLRTRTFVESAKVSGASSSRIVFRHILPRILHISLLYMTVAVASALVLEATFNFLGLTSPAVVTWGQMLSFTYHTSAARFSLGRIMPWWTIFPPALAISYVVLSFFLISVGLRESMRITSERF